MEAIHSVRQTAVETTFFAKFNEKRPFNRNCQVIHACKTPSFEKASKSRDAYVYLTYASHTDIAQFGSSLVEIRSPATACMSSWVNNSVVGGGYEKLYIQSLALIDVDIRRRALLDPVKTV